MTHQTYLQQTGPDEGEIRCYDCGLRVAVQMRDGKIITNKGTKPFIYIEHGPVDVQHSFSQLGVQE